MYKQFFKQSLIYILAHYLLCMLFFLLGQKPLFLFWYRGYNGTVYQLSDICDIYVNGLAIDAATAGYLSIVPILILAGSVFWGNGACSKALTVYAAIASLLMVLATIADVSLYEFWGFKLDKMAFYYLADPKDAFASVTTMYLLARILVVMVLWYVVWRCLCLPVNVLTDMELPVNASLRVILLLWFVLIGGIDFLFIRGWRIWPNTPARVFYSSETFFNHAALNPLFNVLYSTTKKEQFNKEFRFFSDEERERIFSPLFPLVSDTTDCILKQKRPNILLIVLESYGGYYLADLDANRPSVGKNINRIMTGNSLWFSNAFAGSFRTDRGIVCVLSGYLGQPTTSIMRYTHKIKNLPGLAKTLRANGYDTQMLYSGDATFFNMADYFLAAGHNRIISQDHFPQKDKTTQWGVPDHVAFKWLYDDIQRKQKSKTPWYTTYLTISSHNPFDVPFHQLADKTDNAFAYTDSCFGWFIDHLKETQAWDNLLVVVTADHGYPYLSSENPLFPHIPLFFTGGALAQTGRKEMLVSQTDIPATILGQLGLPHQDFPFSRDVFSHNYTYPFAMMTYNGGYQFRDSTGVTVYDLNGQRMVSGSNHQREIKAQAILQTLYDDLNNR